MGQKHANTYTHIHTQHFHQLSALNTGRCIRRPASAMYHTSCEKRVLYSSFCSVVPATPALSLRPLSALRRRRFSPLGRRLSSAAPTSPFPPRTASFVGPASVLGAPNTVSISYVANDFDLDGHKEGAHRTAKIVNFSCISSTKYWVGEARYIHVLCYVGSNGTLFANAITRDASKLNKL